MKDIATQDLIDELLSRLLGDCWSHVHARIDHIEQTLHEHGIYAERPATAAEQRPS